MESERERTKQDREVEAWLRIAQEKGDEFMRATNREGDLEAYRDRIIVDLGCGPRPFVEHFPARMSFMIDCCMRAYLENGLLQPSTLSNACCIDAQAERLPLCDGAVDFLFAINMLDHTFDPRGVADEMTRVVRTGGHIHVQVDIGGKPNECEPTVFTPEDVMALFEGLSPIHYEKSPASNPGRDHRMDIVFWKRSGAEASTERGAMPLDVLACPRCRGALEEAENSVTCQGCHTVFARRDGVYSLKP